MSRPGPDASTVWAAEEKLSGHPAFGDSDRIQRRMRERYQFAARILTATSAGTAEVAPNLADGDADRMWRDPVVRRSLEDGLRRLEQGEAAALDEVTTVLDLASERLTRCHDLLPAQAEDDLVLRAGPAGLIWLPSMTGQPGPLLQRCHEAMTDKFIGHNELSGQFRPAGPAAARSIDRGAELLTAVLPRLGAGVLGHIAAVGLLAGSGPEGRQLSAAGGDPVPGMIVMSPGLLESAWATASLLLHEGLHLKAFDITRSYSLISAPHATVEIPWRRVRWDARRVLFACHVYAHVALFQAAAACRDGELTGRFGSLPENAAIGRGADEAFAGAVQRALFLGTQLEGPLAGCLTADGRRFTSWLLESTAPLTGWQPAARRDLAEPAAVRTGGPADCRPPLPRYRRAAEIVVRPLPELEIALVYNPGDRVLSCLNLNAWAVLELCDGRASIEPDYRELVRARLSPGEVGRQLRLALRQLSARGLIETTEGGDPA